MDFGGATIVPFAVAIFLLLWQEDVLLPLLAGLLIGGIMLAKFNPLLGLYKTAGDLILGSMLGVQNIILLIIIAEVLILYAFLNRYGFINTFTKKTGKRLQTREKLETTVFLSSLFIFIDRHLSTLLAGIFTKPLIEKRPISPLKHAYLLNTVSSSVSTLIPLTIITPIVLTAIGSAFKGLGVEFSPLRALLLSLPFQFYNIFSLFTAVTLLILQKDTLFMKRRMEEEQSEKILSFGLALNTRSQGNGTVAFYGVIATLGVLFGVITIGVLMNRKDIIIPTVQPLQNYGPLFINALFVSILFILLFLLISRTMRYAEWRDSKSLRTASHDRLIITLIYVVLASSMEVLARRIGLGSNILGGLTSAKMSANFIPLLIFVLSCLVSFLSGSSPLTISVLLPIALRIMSANMTDPLLVDRLIYATIGAVLSGATFGDMNSPLSLNYILATAATHAPIRNRFIAQIGYSIIAFGATVVFGFLLFTTGVKPYVSISSGFLVIALLLIFLTGRLINQ
jgi:Na+/H+ antiporter NhaC